MSRLRPDTRILHDDDAVDSSAGSGVVAPIHYSATFSARDAEDFADMATRARHPTYYTRYGNPGHERVSAVLAGLEGSETALLSASGMGAISTTILALLKAGDHVIAQTRHYMGTSRLFDELLPRFGISTTLVAQGDIGAIEAALRPDTRLIMLETPANPTLTLTDLSAVAALARSRGILTVADNTFATPLNQRPLEHGIDIVVHSATKYLGGHHDLTAGAVCCTDSIAEQIWNTHTILGAVLSPMDAWLLLRGLRTLTVRVERINTTALSIARWLESRTEVERVFHPGLESHPQHALAARQMTGFGGVIAFSLKGGFDAASRFVGALQLARQAVSLGGVESLVVHAAAMWSGTMNEAQMRQAAIDPAMVRFSIGLEHPEDLKTDLDRALSAAGSAPP